MTSQDRDKLLNEMKSITLVKGETLLMQNMICDFLGFVEKGCLRSVRREVDGTEITLTFTTEDAWVTSINSFTNSVPSDYAIEAVEYSRLLYIDRDVLFEMAAASPNIDRFMRVLYQKKLIELERRIIGLLQDTAGNRYKKLEFESPDLLNRLPKNYVATYLGILSGSLSRILKGFREDSSASRQN